MSATNNDKDVIIPIDAIENQFDIKLLDDNDDWESGEKIKFTNKYDYIYFIKTNINLRLTLKSVYMMGDPVAKSIDHLYEFISADNDFYENIFNKLNGQTFYIILDKIYHISEFSELKNILVGISSHDLNKVVDIDRTVLGIRFIKVMNVFGKFLLKRIYKQYNHLF